MQMTWRELLKSGSRRLLDAGIQDAEYDARSILLEVSGMNLTTYALRAEEQADETVTEHFDQLITRRAGHEPLQYIFGEAPFCGREFLVRPGVLIPRFDTETLVEALLPSLRSGMSLLDLCTGSGCILLTLLLDGPAGMSGCGCDISAEALACARENAERFGASANFVESDLFEHIEGTYDIITANPPYIRSADIPGLAPEVVMHEPVLALDGGEDGLSYYRRIAAKAPEYLKDGGILGFEIGYDESEDVAGIMEENGFHSITVKHDLSWNTRAVIGRFGF